MDELFKYQTKANSVIEDWGRQSKSRFLVQLSALPFKERIKARSEILRGRVQLKFRRQYGDIVRVTFPFARHGIFQEHGVGSGRKKGSGKEKPMPWIEPTFNAQVPILADLIKDEAIKGYFSVIQIKVNGIFDVEIR